MNKSHKVPSAPSHAGPKEPSRRDFMVLTTGALASVGAVCAVWPFIDSMNPSADVLALSSIEVDISSIGLGQQKKVKWRGAPVMIRHRTPEDIKAMQEVNVSELRDPQTDEQRTKPGHEQWLVVIDVCTHLGCIPLANAGVYKDGWFCPCHGSQYDAAGRIRSGPAPKNLYLPEYTFLTDTKIKIG
jgi:ubiquinol-cytochrome c reductase iron-sulfur subunit